MQSNKIEIPNIPVPIVLIKSLRAKKLSMTIKPSKPIRVTIPRHISYKAAQQFVESNIDWLKKAYKRVQKAHELQQGNRIKLPIIHLPLAKKHLIDRLQHLARTHNFKYNRATIRTQKTIWGSCSHANNISLNANLIRLPQHLQDYVILHELVHTKVKSHQIKFWRTLDKYTQCNSKLIDKQLKRYTPGYQTLIDPPIKKLA